MKIKGLRDSVTEYLRTQIITGRLSPGQRLNEGELSEMFNVSRSPLREALLILEREDLVVSIPRKGTYVTPMSEENVKMIYQVMDMVELYAIDHMRAHKITHLPELAAAVDRCNGVRISSRRGWEELLEYRKILAGFHYKLVEVIDNPFILNFYRRTSANLARYQYLQLSETGSGGEMIKEHKHIVGCIERRAYTKARELLKAHIKKSFQYKVDALKKFGKTGEENIALPG